MNPAAQSKPPMFTGKSVTRLDDKRRLTVPANWRFDGEGGSSYLALYNPLHAAIIVYPPDMQDKLMEASRRADVVGQPELYDVIQELAVFAAPVTCDKAGRIVLPADMLKVAGIERDVVLKGGFSNFTIRSATPPAEDRTSETSKRLQRGLAALGFGAPVPA